jgi:hypothetical protein
VKIYGLKNVSKSDARKFRFVIKTKDKVLFGQYDYNNAKTRIRRVPERLVKYYGICIYESKDEAYRHFYKCVRMNKYKMERWEVKKISVGKLDKLFNRRGI